MKESLQTAFELASTAFTSNKVRSALAVLGVTIGISSIIIVFSAGEGVRGLLNAQVDSFGANILQTEIKVPSSKSGVAGETQSATSLLQGAMVTTMSLNDLDDFLELPNVLNGYAMSITSEKVTYRGQVENATIWAAGAAMIDIDKADVETGRFFSDSEDRSLAQVAVLGSNVKEKLFGDGDPINRTIKVRNMRMRVIGVMEERGGVLGFNFDDMIYIPIRTYQKRLLGANYVQSIMVQVEDMSLSEGTMDQMRVIMRENHDIDAPLIAEERNSIFDTGKDDFRVVSMSETIEVFDQAQGALLFLLLAIVAVSLVVGGVGVMNVMYVIVNERTPEIGLRKAVGANQKDIMTQFLFESVMITGVGGIVGTIIGVSMSWVIAYGATSAGYTWEFHIPLTAFITAFLFSIIFGVLFGLYPARKAAQLDPIEALQQNN